MYASCTLCDVYAVGGDVLYHVSCAMVHDVSYVAVLTHPVGIARWKMKKR